MLIALVGLQTACGFHPRGVVGLPDHIAPLFLDLSSTDDGLGHELRILLSSSDKDDLAISKTKAKTILTISNMQKKQRLVAVDNLGRAHEYELNYQFNYELKKTSMANTQSAIIKTNRVELKRDLFFDPNNVLASGYENEALYEDMRKEAARIILGQLNVIKPIALQQE